MLLFKTCSFGTIEFLHLLHNSPRVIQQSPGPCLTEDTRLVNRAP